LTPGQYPEANSQLDRAQRQINNAINDDSTINGREAATTYARYGELYFDTPEFAGNPNIDVLESIRDNYSFDSRQTQQMFDRMVLLFHLGADPQDTEPPDPSFQDRKKVLDQWAVRQDSRLRPDLRQLSTFVRNHIIRD
jgi:hypothetical protein